MLAGLDNPFHIAIVLLVVLVLFGTKRLPELGRSLGAGLREFKEGATSTPGGPPAGATDSADTRPDQTDR